MYIFLACLREIFVMTKLCGLVEYKLYSGHYLEKLYVMLTNILYWLVTSKHMFVVIDCMLVPVAL